MERASARAADGAVGCAPVRVPEQPRVEHVDQTARRRCPPGASGPAGAAVPDGAPVPAGADRGSASPGGTGPADADSADSPVGGPFTNAGPAESPVGAAPADVHRGAARPTGAPPDGEARPPERSPRRNVQRPSVRGQVLDALRAALVGGDLVPGEVYSAPALGERFGVSATPVREAMQQLALEGAVEVMPNRGFRVLGRGARELAELAEVRALIEVPVMLRLARSVPATEWTRLRPLAEATVAAAAVGDLARYAEADRAFHGALLGLTGNRQLVQVADDLHRRSQWHPVTGPRGGRRADLVADAAEHLALLEALVARDLPVVQSLVREHFAGGEV